MRMSIFLFKNFFLERFGQYLKKSKNGFPIVFSNLAREGSRGFFQARKLIFFPNGLYLPTKQPWGSPKFGFCHHHLQLSPILSSKMEHKKNLKTKHQCKTSVKLA